jgi:hypothetical protein
MQQNNEVLDCPKEEEDWQNTFLIFAGRREPDVREKYERKLLGKKTAGR